MPVKLLSRVWLFAIPWTVAYQVPPSMEFSRQESWSRLTFPSPGDLPDPGIEPRFPTLRADALLYELPGKPNVMECQITVWPFEGNNIQKTRIMASSPITSWQTGGETMETVTNFIFLGSKITADGHRSHGIKRPLLLGRKVMTNLDNIFKSRDITLPTNVHLVKAMVFPVVMYGCESWTVKKAEHWRIDAFELWC